LIVPGLGSCEGKLSSAKTGTSGDLRSFGHLRSSICSGLANGSEAVSMKREPLWVASSGCGDTAQDPLIHVGTPSRGSTHRFRTKHARTTPIKIAVSTIFLCLIGLGHPQTSCRITFCLPINYIFNRQFSQARVPRHWDEFLDLMSDRLRMLAAKTRSGRG